jgi:Ca-activated chloride channel family protein
MRYSPGFPLLILPLATFLVAGTETAGAQSTPATVIIVDGSGSMWGALGTERTSKFDLTRDALRQSFARVSPEARVGLVSFGHRRKGDCSDVEAIAAPEPGPIDRIPSLVDKLNPKGRGPLVLALKEAAKMVDPASAGNVILLHDGADNCQLDACAAAAEIAKANPRLVVHVIGLGLEKADAQRMICVPSVTKGKMFDVRDAATLKAALNEALTLANLDQTSPAARPEAATTQPQTYTPGSEAVSGPPGLRITAALAANGPALTQPVAWRIMKDETPDEVVIERSAPEIFEKLPQGTYIVEARLGLATARQTVEAASKGPTIVRIVFNAGTLKLTARANNNGDPLANPFVTISNASAADAEPARGTQAIWIGREPDAEVVAPAGSYHVRVEDGLAHREVVVAVAAGARAEVPLNLGTGRLELSAVDREGGENFEAVTFLIAEDDPDSPQGRREVARSAAAHADFILPAGTYYVTAKLANTEARERIAIGTGDIVKHTLALNVARLYLSAQLDGTAAPADQPVTFRVLHLDGNIAREIARSTEATPLFLLSQGRYRIEAQLGTLNVKAAMEVDLVPGKDVKLMLKLDSGQVTIKPARGVETGAPEGQWQVRDSGGSVVLRSGHGDSRTARLAPGRYVVRFETGERRSEKTFELKPGDRRTVEGAPE